MANASALPLQLDLAEAGPVLVEAVGRDGEKRTLSVRNYTLKDEKRLVDEFGTAGVFQKMVVENDIETAVRCFLMQLNEPDLAWVAAQVGMDGAERTPIGLAPAVMELWPAGVLDTVFAAIYSARVQSWPEAPAGQESKKKIAAYLLTTLSAFACGILAGAYLQSTLF